MQSKISSFFKPQQQTETPNQPQLLDLTNHPLRSRYKDPQIPVPDKGRSANDIKNGCGSLQIEASQEYGSAGFPLKSTSNSTRILNKKRSYAQLHLDLGQSDFLLHTCSVCSFKYARGDEGDEKVHKEFHKDYTQGIQFKGWHNERVVHVPSNEAGHIILVVDGDPPARKKKVQKVMEMMEMELGSGWLIHKLCKVYLFIFHQRVAGCLVAEPIKNAYTVLSNSVARQSLDVTNVNKNSSTSFILRFGDINFKMEAMRKTLSNDLEALEEDLMGAMFIENEAVPAVCGIRAIWVAPAMRRKHIASQLLDAARISFCKDIVLKPSQLAFSDPTSTGKALASRYCGTASFLAYKTDV